MWLIDLGGAVFLPSHNTFTYSPNESPMPTQHTRESSNALTPSFPAVNLSGLLRLTKCPISSPAALYSAPEVQRGQWHLCGRRADIWSLGVMVLEMILNERPSYRFQRLSDLSNADIDLLIESQLGRVQAVTDDVFFRDLLQLALQV